MKSLYFKFLRKMNMNNHVKPFCSLEYTTASQRYCIEGEVEALNIKNYIHLLQNEQSRPTCLHRRHGTTSRPDLTFDSADIHNRTNIKIVDDIGCDHLPILTTIDLRQQKRPRAERKTFWNFKKANCKAYI